MPPSRRWAVEASTASAGHGRRSDPDNAVSVAVAARAHASGGPCEASSLLAGSSPGQIVSRGVAAGGRSGRSRPGATTTLSICPLAPAKAPVPPVIAAVTVAGVVDGRRHQRGPEPQRPLPRSSPATRGRRSDRHHTGDHHQGSHHPNPEGATASPPAATGRGLLRLDALPAWATSPSVEAVGFASGSAQSRGGQGRGWVCKRPASPPRKPARTVVPSQPTVTHQPNSADQTLNWSAAKPRSTDVGRGYRRTGYRR
jgi:hypothetical protein